MNNPLGVSPSKGIQGATQGKEKIILTLVGIKPTTSRLDLPLLCRLSYEVGQRSDSNDWTDGQTVMVRQTSDSNSRSNREVVG